ncbi:hypothetical protein QJQ45_016979 [Haematococcus lacustris]|nr:hypothetical protein QJQ45_016979 [Haematococcus lacustris]
MMHTWSPRLASPRLIEIAPHAPQLPRRSSASTSSSCSGITGTNSEDGSSNGSDAALVDWTTEFPELFAAMESAVHALGGKVVPKLNWSCPSDATWVNPLSSLACDNAEQVVLMLKSSDRVAHDLELLEAAAAAPPLGAAAPHDLGHAGQTHTAQVSYQPMLVLRKWYELRPEREWRCFVRNHQLVAICQRDPTQHFPQLSQAPSAASSLPAPAPAPAPTPRVNPSIDSSAPAFPSLVDGSREAGGVGRSTVEGVGQVGAEADALQQQALFAPGPLALEAVQRLRHFFRRTVQHRFEAAHYTFDAYVASTGTVKLLDFNPAGATTSPLLYSWEEMGYLPAELWSDAPGQEPAAAPTLGSEGHSAAHASPAGQRNGGADSGTDSSSEDGVGGDGEVMVRIAPAMAIVQPGVRAACAMPFDMLSLQGTLEQLQMQHG